MKTILLISFMLMLPFTGDQNQNSDLLLGSDPADKEFLLNYYTETEGELWEEVQGLSEEQLNFKASPESWSVAENLEHIIITEKAIFEGVKALLHKEPNPADREKVKATDEAVVQQITDRSSKFKTSPDLTPSDLYNSPEEAMDAFKAQREEITGFIKNSEEDFRNYVSESPFGFNDAYQSLLFIAGHTARHTLQIEEVKAAPGFPME